MLRSADTDLRMGDELGKRCSTQAMSEEQLSALLAKLKEDAVLREKLKGAGDLDAAVGLPRQLDLMSARRIGSGIRQIRP